MEKLSTVLYGIISLAVIVILVATVAIPVINDSQTELYSTAQNTTQLYAATSSSDADLTITFSDSVITVNDYVVPTATSNVVLLCGKSCLFATNSGLRWLSYEDSYVVNSVTSFIVSDGAYNINNGSKTGTLPDNTIYYAAENGTYGVFDSSNFNINSNTPLIGVRFNFTAGGHTNTHLIGVGTYDNMSVSMYTNSGQPETTITDWTDASATISTTEKNGYLTVDSSSVVGTYPGSETPTTVSGGFTKYIAPIEYKYLEKQDNMYFVLLSIIPMLLIIIPVVLAARLITNGRD